MLWTRSSAEVAPTTLLVPGGAPVGGRFSVPGAKNAAMPSMIAAALAPGEVSVLGLPDIADVWRLVDVLRHLDVPVDVGAQGMTVGEPSYRRTTLPARISGRLRGSVYALALLAFADGERETGPIGGDTLTDAGGRRHALAPHARALAGLGLTLRGSRPGWTLAGQPRPGEFAVDDDGLSASALAALVASRLEGRSVIREASTEPELDDLLAVLTALGASARRDGRTVVVHGPLTGTRAPVVIGPDRMYAGTIAVAAATAGGWVGLEPAVAARMDGVLEALDAFGVSITRQPEGGVVVSGTPTAAARIRSGPFPMFPTDLLPPLTVLAAQAPGRSVLVEGVYRSRNDHVAGLRVLGARISAEGPHIVVDGPTRWRPARVAGSGVRETCALYLAARLAPGTSEITNAGALARGYGDLGRTLSLMSRKGA